MSLKRLPTGLRLFATAPLQIVDYPADEAHMGGERTMPPQFIYMHATGGEHSIPWLSRTSSPPVSAHRHIDKAGVITKIVPDNRVAYTQGYGVMGVHIPHGVVTCNTDGLSIECENWDTVEDKYPDVQVASAALQVFEWWGEYGFLPVLSHYDVDTRKKDPAYFPWGLMWDFLYRLMRGGNLGSVQGWAVKQP